MKAKIYLLAVILIFVSCSGKKQQEKNTISSEDSTVENKQNELDTLLNNDSTHVVEAKSLNDIRFGGWTDKDWYDNDYFRYLRKSFNTCYESKSYSGVDESELSKLQEYKSMLHSEFIVYNAEPFIAGGLFVTLIFVEYPDTMFQTAVYSDVDEKTKTLIGTYHLRGFEKMSEPSNITKEQILEMVKEHPENKLW